MLRVSGEFTARVGSTSESDSLPPRMGDHVSVEAHPEFREGDSMYTSSGFSGIEMSTRCGMRITYSSQTSLSCRICLVLGSTPSKRMGGCVRQNAGCRTLASAAISPNEIGGPRLRQLEFSLEAASHRGTGSIRHGVDRQRAGGCESPVPGRPHQPTRVRMGA